MHSPGIIAIFSLLSHAGLTAQANEPVLLQEVISNRTRVRDTETPEMRQAAENWAEQYQKLRKSKQVRSFRGYCEKHESDAICSLRQEPSVFDEWTAIFEENASRPAPRFHFGLPGKSRKSKVEIKGKSQFILQAIAASQWEVLRFYPKDEIARAGQHASSLFEIGNLYASGALKESCLPPAFFVNLALKAEEWLPDESARKLIIALYEKSLSCDGLTEDQEGRARFRVSLFHLWQGGCESARPHLERLTRLNDTDYSARGLYWLARCAQQEGEDSKEFIAYRDRLRELNPLSFQLLLLQKGKPPTEWSEYLKRSEISTVQPRTSNETVDRAIQAVEYWISKKELDLAREVARAIDLNSDALPARFKLYLAGLAHHLSDHFIQFRAADAAFKADHSLITAETLKLLFPLRYQETIEKHRGDLSFYFISGLIRQESGFTPFARSPVGALGLMQLMPGTAKLFGRVSRSMLFQPEPNVKVGSKYLRSLVGRFDGDLELALASYNAGPIRVEEWARRYPVQDRVLFLDLIPFLETRKYVSLINRNFFWYAQLYAPEGLKAFEEASRGLASLREKVVSTSESEE